MKKIFTGCFLLVFLLNFHHAYPQGVQHCYTTEVYREVLKHHPEMKAVQNQLEQQTRHLSKESLSAMQRTRGTVLIIPIVFHIIHNYGPENISDAQVIDQVRVLNEDYRLLSADTGAIIPAFKNIAADCEIEFRLATLDPNGNCTNGIDRVVSPLTVNADDNSKLNPWPDDQYLNVWVVRSLAWGGAAAYAYYPGTAPAGADGVISIYRYIGSIGTSSVGTSRVLTHEIGHYLNLQHVWGSTNNPGIACGDDLVFDTPVTEGWTSCNLNGSSCGNLHDNVQNYMEYAYCSNMFTQGQKTRMLDALQSPVSGRNNLWTAANLIATGTTGASSPLCAPEADFVSSKSMFCVSNSIQFFDASWKGKPTSWSWTFPGGSPGVSTDSMPVIQYPTSGTYDATLTVSNATGSNTVTKVNYVHVGGLPVNAIPYAESFELPGSFPGPDAQVINPDGGNSWVRVSNAAATGIASIMINNYSGNLNEATDDYITGGFNFSGQYVPALTFKVAYAERDTSYDDLLTVSASDDCGTTWTTRYTKNGASLSTVPGIYPAYFIPGATQWRQESVIFPTMRNKSNVRFRFQNRSEEGNNLYIDDINITVLPVGLAELPASGNELSIYPNPSAGEVTINFIAPNRNNVQIQLLDMAGREIKKIYSGPLSAGAHEFKCGEDLPEGIYFIRLQDADGVKVKRFTVTN